MTGLDDLSHIQISFAGLDFCFIVLEFSFTILAFNIIEGVLQWVVGLAGLHLDTGRSFRSRRSPWGKGFLLGGLPVAIRISLVRVCVEVQFGLDFLPLSSL